MRRLGGFVVMGALALGCGFDTEGIGRELDVDVDDDADDDDAADDPAADPTAATLPPDDSVGTTTGAGTATTAADPSTSGAGDDSGDETAGIVPQTSNASADDGGSTTDSTTGRAAESSGGEPGDGSTSGDPSDSDAETGNAGDTGNQACPAAFTGLWWADEAALFGPMALLTDTAAMGDPDVATSEVADSGTVTFTVDVPCPGEYLVWGLVWDYWPGAYASDDPDSHYVAANGGGEVVWRYGCQTTEGDDGLSWQRFEGLQAQPCDTVALVLDVEAAGEHTLSFRNREWGSGSVVAGISAVILTTDASLDPYDEYAPY